jgi:hypothetical protein
MNIERSVRSILATEYRPIEAQAYVRHHLDIFLTHAAQFMSVRMNRSLASESKRDSCLLKPILPGASAASVRLVFYTPQA